MNGSNNPHVVYARSNREKAAGYPTTVTLTCGHTVPRSLPPFHNSRFACQANQGCGYLLDWVSYVDGGFTHHNRKFNKEN